MCKHGKPIHFIFMKFMKFLIQIIHLCIFWMLLHVLFEKQRSYSNITMSSLMAGIIYYVSLLFIFVSLLVLLHCYFIYILILIIYFLHTSFSQETEKLLKDHHDYLNRRFIDTFILFFIMHFFIDMFILIFIMHLEPF